MAKKNTDVEPKKKHHRMKKLMKLAVLAGAAYGAKKIYDAGKRSGSKGK